MVSSVKSRRNHYEILGLSPGATDDEIAAAFATESRKIIQNPRVNEPDVREKARQVRTAHQTLRDPAKRAAYDASIGLGAKAQDEAPQAPAEPADRPFVAAARDKPDDGPGPSGDEHIADKAAESRDTGPTRAPQPRPEPQTNARTGLPEGLFVAAMAGKAASKAATHPTDNQTASSQAEAPPSASAPETPSVAAQTDQGGASETAAAPPPQPEPEAAPEHIAEPTAEPAAEPAYRFEDPGAESAAFYGEQRDRKVNRAAAGGVAALAAALAVGAFWLWPSENSVEPTSSSPAGSQVAAADETGVPPDVLNGLPPEPATTDDPFADTEMAAVGSYQSVTFADSGPIPTVGAPPLDTASPTMPGPAASEPVASPPAAADPGQANEAPPPPTTTTTATTAAPSATPALPVVSVPVATNVPRRAQPAPDLRPVTPPKLVRGTILNSDNRRGAFQGTVSVRFTVGANGRPTGCTPTASSGNPRLDAHTCELVQQRLQFAPATTAQGQPVASEMRATYTWGRKRRSLTGRLLDIVR